MNKDQFHQYLNYPDQLDSNSLNELEEMVKEYPYFNTARMLYVKNLKNLDNIKFNRELKTAAAYINNRTYLFGLLNEIYISSSGSFFPKRLLEQIGDSDEPLEIGKAGDLLSLDLGESGQITPSQKKDEIPQYDKSIYVRELERFIPVADMDLLLFDFPAGDLETLEFDFDNQLPDISGDQLPPETSHAGHRKADGVSSRDLIDEFIRKNPRMPRPEESEPVDGEISIGGLEESEAFMTETLAEIYMKQGYYYKALQTYEKLSLKYPEKSTYFASQIQKIKELIINQ